MTAVAMRQDGPITRLILLNGAPGVGKSTLAQRYLDDHPLTLLLDIDAIRVSLGCWQDRDESKLLARHLALGLAQAHLRAGYDVIVPQYLGRIEFILALGTQRTTPRPNSLRSSCRTPKQRSSSASVGDETSSLTKNAIIRMRTWMERPYHP